MNPRKKSRRTMIGGVYTALVTPFQFGGKIDFHALVQILDQQIRLGVRGFVVGGTTGESSTLSLNEKEELFRFVFDYSQGKSLDLVAGTGTNDTRESIVITQLAESIGYRRFLVVVPYYNKPSAAGLQRHFEAIADSVQGEVILYNVPGRTGISLTAETIVALAAHPKITAIKEASGNISFLSEIRSVLAEKKRELVLLSGDDATYFPFLCAGGEGVISVASHICPSAMLAIEKAVKSSDLAVANKIQEEFLPIFRDLFIEANPVPLKWMLAKLGLCENELRLPLVPLQKNSESRLINVLQAYRLDGQEWKI